MLFWTNLGQKNQLSILPENWHTWNFGGGDSAFRVRFSKFRPQNPFSGIFGPKKSKLLVLPENRFTWYLGGADSASGHRFSKFRPQNPLLSIFGPKKSKLPDFFRNCHTEYLNDLILIPKLVF